MPETTTPAADDPIYRVDKFAVPDSARAPLLAKIEMTHALLRQQPGFRADVVLEQISGPGEFNVVTMVEWDGPDVIAAARAAVMAMQRSEGFDPQAMFARLGIRADLANYRAISRGGD